MDTIGHGGARPGAGRKPKALAYAAEVAAAEGKIVAALPELIESLIAAAKGGDVAASRYLLDRVWGRPNLAPAPWADDTALPFTEEDFEDARARAAGDRNFNKLLVDMGRL